MFAMLSHKTIAFNAPSSRVVKGDDDTAAHGMATNGTVGEPYLVPSKKPIGIMRKI